VELCTQGRAGTIQNKAMGLDVSLGAMEAYVPNVQQSRDAGEREVEYAWRRDGSIMLHVCTCSAWMVL
jgi:hypothetical protein